MPVFDLICTECKQFFEDEWGKADEIKQIPCQCGGERQIIIHAVASHWGIDTHDPGIVKTFEMEYTDADGKIRRKDMRGYLNQEKGKLTTPWDGKKVSPKEVEALSRDADPNA